MTLASSEMRVGVDVSFIDHTFRLNPVVAFFWEISPSCLFILDIQNRFLMTNQRMRDFLGAKSEDEVTGRDFGILYRCVENGTGNPGCGRNPECGHCAFFGSLQLALLGNLVQTEFVLNQHDGKSFIFTAMMKKLLLEQREVIAVSMLDISDRKRRETMERMFYHDLINAVSGMTGLLQLTELTPSLNGDAKEMIATSRGCAEYLADEIQFARNLSKAEKGDLELELCNTRLSEILLRAMGFFRMHAENGRIRFDVVNDSPDAIVKTDRTLAVRILVNLIKNAMEAGSGGEVIGIRAKASDSLLTLEVHNRAFMPPAVSDNVFKRAFSTKGAGRGIGTYSVRLFAEHFLHGRVWFTTDPTKGTSFFVEIPC
jgi:signal transduction histidine kinase